MSDSDADSFDREVVGPSRRPTFHEEDDEDDAGVGDVIISGVPQQQQQGVDNNTAPAPAPAQPVDFLSDDDDTPAAVNVNTTTLDTSSPNDDDNGNGNKQNWTLRQCIDRGCKRLDMGAAVLPKPLFSPDVVDYDGSEELRDAASTMQTPYARILSHEFNAIVVEHHLKWAPLCASEPGPLPGGKPSERLGRYDFKHADSVVDWALDRGMRVKGHVLVWAVTSPKFIESLDAATVRTELKRHIFTVMGHYRGRIHTWDVVNEALAPDGTLANNVFLKKLGPSYIEDAFHWAHEADPAATLLYNDNKVEGIGAPKSEAFYQLLADLKAKEVPVHGCGMQCHFNAAGTGRNRPPTPRMVKQQIHRLGELGLTVNFSEMDVRVSQLPSEQRHIAQRQIYHDIISAALTEPAFDGVWLWGFTDRHTWVTHFYYDDEPLIFDENYGRKEAYYGVQQALQSLTPGGTVGGDVLLDTDIDVDGNRWGHLWMTPQIEVGSFDDDVQNNTGGDQEQSNSNNDARPDWEINSNEKEIDSGEQQQNGEDLPPIS